MKNLLIITLLLASGGVFASCPIEGSSACIAQFKTSQLDTPMESALNRNRSLREFTPTPNTTAIDKEYLDKRPLRTFGVTSGDYGYNSSCQFGVCRHTGTPTNFNTYVE